MLLIIIPKSGLVYIAAFAPNQGQSLTSFIDLTKFLKGLLVFDSGGFIYLNPKMFRGALLKMLIRLKLISWL
jgi:hypothetical protein